MKRARAAKLTAKRVMRRNNIIDDDDEEEESEESMESEEADSNESEEEAENEESGKRRNKTRKARPKHSIDEDENSEEVGEEAEEEQDPTTSKKRAEKMSRKKRKARSKESDEEEEDDDEKDEGGNDDEKEKGGGEEEGKQVEEDGESVKKNRKGAKAKQKQRVLEEGEESDEDAHDEDKKRSEKEEGDSEEDIDQTPLKRPRRGASADTPGSASASATKKRKDPPKDDDQDEALKDQTPKKMQEKSTEIEEEEKSENDSPIQKSRKGLSINTVVDDDDDDDDDDMNDKDAPIDVPFVDLQERLRATTNEQELLELLTNIFGELFKQGKTSNRLFSLALIHIVKENPQRFDHPSILKYLLRLLRSKHYSQQKDSGMESKKSGNVQIKDKNEISIAVLVCNVLFHVLKDESEWPADSIKVFLDDSLYSRTWVDHELARIFVENIKTFIDPPTENSNPLIKQRFHGEKNLEEMKELVINHIRTRLQEMEKERMGISSGNTSALRNMILTLTDFSSIPRARALAAENMENWLQNSSVKTPSRDLLTKIVTQCSAGNSIDFETVDSLLKMKLKSTMFQLKVETIGQLIRQNDEYLKLALRVFISRERPNNMGKDVDNMKIIQHIFRAARSSPPSSTNEESFFRAVIPHPGAEASQQLGFVFREFSSTSEVGPVLKTITRKILKQLTFDLVDIKSLCVSILQNEGHWESMKKINHKMMLDHVSLLSGVVWLILLMRGAAVKSLQIQHTNVLPGNRPGASIGISGGSTGLKGTGAQALPRRLLGQAAHRKFGSLNKPKLTKGSGSSVSASGVSNQPTSSDTSGSSRSSVNVSVSIKAKEELVQTLAQVQMQSIVCFRQLADFLKQSGVSSFERNLLDILVKKLLFLEIPADVQPTEHDKTCFASTKEDIPVHEDFLEGLLQIYVRCEGIDRLDALRTIETIVFRAADGHLQRESVWASHDHLDDLEMYRQQGGIVGVHVKNESFVDLLWMLVSYRSKVAKVDKLLCYSSHFWIITTILLIVGSFNPSSVGSYLWRKIPTVRSMMQMLITGRFKFPAIQNFHDPVLTGRTDNSLDLLQTNTRMREYEQMALSAIPGFVPEDPFMILDAENIAREPPAHILDHLQLLDKKFKLGLRLRQSRDQDFLMEMVAGQEASSTSGSSTENTWWIAEIVCEEYDTVMYLPSSCICQLLIMAFTSTQEDKKGKEVDEKHQSIRDTLVQIVPRLLGRLRDFLREYEEEEQTEEGSMSDAAKNASNVILYFLDRLVSPDLLTRRIAAHVLQQLTHSLSQAPTKTSSAENEPSSSEHAYGETEGNSAGSSPQRVEKTEENHEDEITLPDQASFDWLFSLAKLRSYRLIDQKVWSCLEFVLEVESSLDSLKLCTQALYDLWKLQSDTLDASTVLFLGGLYGRFLSNRSFIARLILQDITIWQLFVEVFWTCIENQMQSSNNSGLAGASGECKVFYVMDKKKSICEIKLPIPIIHGAAQVVCLSSSLPASDIQQSKDNNPKIWNSFDRLVDSLFPSPQQRKSPNSGVNKKVIVGNVTSRSVGLIATKDTRLCSEQLLEQIVLSCSNYQIVETAARTLSLGNIVKFLSKFGLKKPCFSILCEILKENMEKNPDQVHQLFVSKKEEVEVEMEEEYQKRKPTPHVLLSCVQLYVEEFKSNDGTTKGNADIIYVEKWLQNLVHEENKSQLKAEPKPVVDSGLRKPSFLHPLGKKRKPQTNRLRSFFSSSSLPFISAKRDDKDTKMHPPFKITSELYDFKHVDGTIIKGKLKNDIDLMESLGSYKTVLISSDSEISQADMSATQAVLLDNLPYFISHCPEKSSKVASILTEILSESFTKRQKQSKKTCCDFISQVFSRIDGTFSFSSTVSFVSSLLQWDGYKTLQMANETELIYRQEMVTLVLEFIKERVNYWQNHQRLGTFLSSAFDLRNLVLLIKTQQLYTRALTSFKSLLFSQQEEFRRNIDLLVAVTRNKQDHSIVHVLNALVESFPIRLVMKIDTKRHHWENIHQEIQTDFLKVLYFQYPKTVLGHLQGLIPHWEELLLQSSSSIYEVVLTDILDPRIVSVVDSTLEAVISSNANGNDDHSKASNGHSSGVLFSVDMREQLRSLIVHHPLIVLNRLPVQFGKMIGKVSLTQLYLQANIYNNVLDVVHMVRLNGSGESARVFCDCMARILFEVLEVIVSHQALEFTPLVERILGVFVLYLQVDYDLVFGCCLQKPRWKNILENLETLYQEQDEIIKQLNILMGKINNAPSLDDDDDDDDHHHHHHPYPKKESKKKQKHSQHQQHLGLLGLQDERFLYIKQRNPQVDTLDLHRVEVAIDFFQEQIQFQSQKNEQLSQQLVLPFFRLLIDPKMSKSLLNRLIQTLVQIVRTEETACTERILLEYAKILRLFRGSSTTTHRHHTQVAVINPSLKDTIVSYAIDLLVCCRNKMTRQLILQELFMDQSEFSKSKLLTYFKSSMIKSIHSFGTGAPMSAPSIPLSSHLTAASTTTHTNGSVIHSSSSSTMTPTNTNSKR